MGGNTDGVHRLSRKGRGSCKIAVLCDLFEDNSLAVKRTVSVVVVGLDVKHEFVTFRAYCYHFDVYDGDFSFDFTFLQIVDIFIGHHEVTVLSF